MKHYVRPIPVFHLVAVDQYANDNDNDNNSNTRYDDCYYDCNVCSFACMETNTNYARQCLYNVKYRPKYSFFLI